MAGMLDPSQFQFDPNLLQQLLGKTMQSQPPQPSVVQDPRMYEAMIRSQQQAVPQQPQQQGPIPINVPDVQFSDMMKKKALGQALMAGGLSLLTGMQKTRMPQSPFANIGQAGLAGMQAYQGTMNNNMAQALEYAKMQRAMQGGIGDQPSDTLLYSELAGSADPEKKSKAQRMIEFRRAQAGETFNVTNAREEAKARVEKGVSFPKMRDRLNSLKLQWSNVEKNIDDAIKRVGPFTAGVGSWAAGIPATPQKDLRELLDSIKANIGFDKLAEMRATSPSGGALGQVSDFENKLLQAVQGSLDQSQSAGQLKANLQTVKDMLNALRSQKDEAFNMDYAEFANRGPKPRQKQPAPLGGNEMTATNPTTGQKIKSVDGGKTWQAM